MPQNRLELLDFLAGPLNSLKTMTSHTDVTKLSTGLSSVSVIGTWTPLGTLYTVTYAASILDFIA